jgi:tape measure domain-containing protein
MAGELERLLIRVEADTAQLRRALANADKDVSSFADKAERHAGRLEARFKSLMVGFSAGYLVREAVKLADAYTLMGNRLAVVTKSAAELSYVQESLFKTAQATRLDLGELNELYARMAFALKDVGVSTNDVLQMTETLSKATVASGASQSEAAGALRQLSQAMASGVLRGQELNSVMEQLPMVADMIARHMGVTIGQLRNLAEEGKLTSKAVRDALLSSQDDIADKFSKTVPTIDQGLTQVSNSMLGFVGQLGQSTGVSRGLADALAAIAEALANANEELKQTGTFSIWEKIKNVPQWIVDRISMKPVTQSSGHPGLKGSLFGTDSFGSDGGASFDPNAKGADRTPAAANPWAASIIPVSAEEQLKEMKTVWDELRQAQNATLDDLLGNKMETAANKMAALTEAVRSGSISWGDFSDGIKATEMQTQRSNDAMLSATSQFLDTMFTNNKTAATASALINTYQGISKALTEYSPPYSFAMAAMQAAMGFAQVRAIQSTSKSSRGGSGSASLSGGGAAASAGGGATAAAPATQTQTLTVRGLGVGELLDRRGLRDLLERIRDMQRDGYQLVV